MIPDFCWLFMWFFFIVKLISGCTKNIGYWKFVKDTHNFIIFSKNIFMIFGCWGVLIMIYVWSRLSLLNGSDNHHLQEKLWAWLVSLSYFYNGSMDALIQTWVCLACSFTDQEDIIYFFWCYRVLEYLLVLSLLLHVYCGYLRNLEYLI